MSQVELKDVSKFFGNVRAVDRMNISMKDGECMAMLGPSGCGKTTTLRMVAGFEDLDEGEIRVGERLISSKAKNYYLPPEHRNFGMVFQAFAVWPHLSIYENVAFPLHIRKLSAGEIRQRTEEALKNTNLLQVAKESPDSLSGGGKQRVALARALAIRPDVMLLDEPLSSLDPHFREEMRFEIKDLQKKFGFSILYVTHDQSEAMALSDRILVMKAGVLQQIGTPLEVYGNPANRFVFEFIGLSCFVPAGLTANGFVLGGVTYPWPKGGEASAELIAAGKGILASRPSEIGFVSEGGVRGVVERKVYLGETIDYRVRVADTEVRIQKTRRSIGPSVGENCGLSFDRSHWYPAD